MAAGKRVRRGWLATWWPLVLIVAVLLAGCVWLLTADPQQQAAAPQPAAAAPAPQPTWTTYVDQMPEECFPMLDAGSDFFDATIELNKLQIEAMKLDKIAKETGSAKKWAEAGKKWDEAKRLEQRANRASRIFADAYNRCLEA